MDAAILDFEEKLGVRPVFGGVHTSFGTKNALVNLGKGCYLELIAADESTTEVPKPRWMGIDLLQKNQLTRWALKSEHLEREASILKKGNSAMGQVRSGSRNLKDGSLLQWELAMPLPQPEVELLPFLLDWSLSKMHPTDSIPDKGCRLIALFGAHPTPEIYQPIFEELKVDFQIKTSNEIQLKAIIECPKGRIEI